MYKSLFGLILGLGITIPISFLCFVIAVIFSIATPVKPYYEVIQSSAFVAMVITPVIGAIVGFVWGWRQARGMK